MHGFIFILAGLSVCIWIYLLLARGRFWQVTIRHVPPSASPARITAIIPARNEAEHIGRTITSLQAQSGCQELRIFVVDDESSDGTADAARTTDRSEAVTIIEGKPLPIGWTGKLWAVEQGIEQARRTHPDFLLLTDADIVYSPESVAALVAITQDRNADLASYMVKLHCRSLAEKLLIPAFVFFFFKLYPPAWIANDRRSIAGAAGGCVLVRPEALDRAGGIAAIRNELIDDCALAALVKRSGGRIWLGLTPAIESTRSYESFAAVGRMISRTAFYQLRHSTVLLAASIAGLVVTYVVPPLALLSARNAAICGALAWGLMAGCYLPMVRFYGLGTQWALTLPAAAVFYMAETIRSALNYWAHRGGEWKGRVQDTGDLRRSPFERPPTS